MFKDTSQSFTKDKPQKNQNKVIKNDMHTCCISVQRHVTDNVTERNLSGNDYTISCVICVVVEKLHFAGDHRVRR